MSKPTPPPSQPSPPDQDDATPPITRLSDDDAKALDALLDARSLGADQGPMPPGTADRSHQLRQLLALLDAGDPVADPSLDTTPPADLAARTAAHAAEEAQRQRFALQVQQLQDGGGASPGLGVSARQIATAAAVLLLSGSLLLPVLEKGRQASERSVCKANLMGVAEGLTAYAADHQGHLPRRDVTPGSEWWAIGDEPSRSNTAQMFLLASGQYVDPGELLCPSNANVQQNELVALAAGGFTDFQRPAQISYSYANQFTPSPIALDDVAHAPVLADKNPLFVGRGSRMVFDTAAALDAPSIAHAGEGHNLLRGDGTVLWAVSPVVDLDGHDDNIWTLQNHTTYTGRETPTDPAHDAFLSP